MPTELLTFDLRPFAIPPALRHPRWRRRALTLRIMIPGLCLLIVGCASDPESSARYVEPEQFAHAESASHRAAPRVGLFDDQASSPSSTPPAGDTAQNAGATSPAADDASAQITSNNTAGDQPADPPDSPARGSIGDAAADGATQANANSGADADAGAYANGAADGATQANANGAANADAGADANSQASDASAEPDATRSGHAAAQGSATRAAARADAASTDRTEPAPSFTVDAMVGQVNGRPLYASEVLEPMHQQLVRLGQDMPASEFHQRVSQLVRLRLEQIVGDAVMLAEAERVLTDRARAGLQFMLQQHREELLRKFGRGSESLANRTLMEQQGMTIDDKLREYRQVLLMRNLLGEKLSHKIHVSRKDIERYYFDNIEQFQPPAARTIRLIRVSAARAARQIEARLESGEPFAQVAASPANRYRPDSGGLMDQKLVGDQPLRQPALNEALAQLNVSEHSGKIQIGRSFWWIYLEEEQAAEGRSLEDAQAEIEQLLVSQQEQRVGLAYRRELFAKGSYNDLTQMQQAVVDIAMARYTGQR